jgi:hypothetical protein
MGQEFRITEEHLTLLRASYVSWCEDEYGAPQIDPKRPYGNSDVPRDIARLLGWKMPTTEYYGPYEKEWDEFAVRVREIHQETKTALQIVLAVGYFKAGLYRADPYRENWMEVD